MENRQTSTSFQTIKLAIPQPQEPGVSIAGVLEQLQPGPTAGRKLALILHGFLGHKDYLYQKRLAYRLPIDSFRFDFRGNHETGGEWRVGGFMNDIADIEAVVAYLTQHYGYVVDLIVGHSRGVFCALRWMCTAEEGKHVRGFVNVSGRYRMEKYVAISNSGWTSGKFRVETISESQKQELESQGYYTVKAVVARKEFNAQITREDLEEFVNFDPSFVWDRFPASTHVLSLHGLADRIVPPYDAFIYARALGARSPGTHNLCYCEDADHNFTGRSEFVIENTLEWLSMLEGGLLRTGIWKTGVRGKL